MQLSSLVASVGREYADQLPDIEIRNVVHDSRKVKSGDLFVAVCGSKTDGHAYIQEAVSRGAKAVVIQDGFEPHLAPAGLSVIRVPDTRLALARIASAFYGHVTQRLCLVGITGTNGKTTTSYLVESILKTKGLPTGVIGTVNYRFGSKVLKAAVTTPESLALQELLHQMVDQKITHVVMEVSSHALRQERVGSCLFDVVVYTNLSRDHLDYHQDMEDYFRCKEKLFTTMLDRVNGQKQPFSVINVDDHWGEKLVESQRGHLLTYGLRPGWADVSALNVSFTLNGIKADVVTPKGAFSIHSPLLGQYNLYNILAATAVGLALGLTGEEIKNGIEALKGIPGRLDQIENACQATVLIDYAHTPDALQNVLRTIRDLKPKRLITVFGCGGNRDRGKRPLMGRIAAQFSQIVIITSDNPRDEDPLEIIKEIEAGLKGSALKKIDPDCIAGNQEINGYLVIPDRRTAIRAASRLVRPGDAVVIAGKGHEDYQIIKGVRLSFYDYLETKYAFSGTH